MKKYWKLLFIWPVLWLGLTIYGENSPIDYSKTVVTLAPITYTTPAQDWQLAAQLFMREVQKNYWKLDNSNYFNEKLKNEVGRVTGYYNTSYVETHFVEMQKLNRQNYLTSAADYIPTYEDFIKCVKSSSQFAGIIFFLEQMKQHPEKIGKCNATTDGIHINLLSMWLKYASSTYAYFNTNQILYVTDSAEFFLFYNFLKPVVNLNSSDFQKLTADCMALQLFLEVVVTNYDDIAREDCFEVAVSKRIAPLISKEKHAAVAAFFKEFQALFLRDADRFLYSFGQEVFREALDVPLYHFSGKYAASPEEWQNYVTQLEQAQQRFADTVEYPRFFTNKAINFMDMSQVYAEKAQFNDFFPSLKTFKAIAQNIYIPSTQQTLWQQFKQEIQQFSNTETLNFLCFCLDIREEYELEFELELGIIYTAAHYLKQLNELKERPSDWLVYKALTTIAHEANKYQFLTEGRAYVIGDFLCLSQADKENRTLLYPYVLLQSIKDYMPEKYRYGIKQYTEAEFIKVIVAYMYNDITIVALNNSLQARLTLARYNSLKEFLAFQYVAIPPVFKGKKVDIKAVQQGLIMQEERINYALYMAERSDIIQSRRQTFWLYKEGKYTRHQYFPLLSTPLISILDKSTITFTLEELEALGKQTQ